MKLWIKMLLTVAGVMVLVGGALILPKILNSYSDEKYVDRIIYADSKNVDVFSNENDVDMTNKMELLGKVFSDGVTTDVLEISYELDDERRSKMTDIIVEELKKWFKNNELGVYFTDIPIDFEGKTSLKDCQLYSIYNENLFFYKATLVMNSANDNEGNFVFTVYMDSNNYKLYLVLVEGVAFEKWLKIDGGNKDYIREFPTGMIKSIFNVTDRIRSYYEVEQDVKDVEYYSDYWVDSVLYSIGENVRWEINIGYNMWSGSQALFVGMTEFYDNLFCYDNMSDVYTKGEY